jgi:hypothetical protein
MRCMLKTITRMPRLIRRSPQVFSMILLKLQFKVITMAQKYMTLMMLSIIKTLLLNKQRNRSILMKRLKSPILRCMTLIINHTQHIKPPGRLKRLLRLMLTMTRSMDRELVIQILKWFQLTRS